MFEEFLYGDQTDLTIVTRALFMDGIEQIYLSSNASDLVSLQGVYDYRGNQNLVLLCSLDLIELCMMDRLTYTVILGVPTLDKCFTKQ